MSNPAQPALAFVLEGPLQSWGVDSRFQRRDTSNFPTKSAILGLICAALGVDKHQTEAPATLASLNALKLTLVRNPLARTSPSGRLTDFHTIGGGYDTSSTWGKLSTPRKAGGGAFGTVITHRTYLTDSAFIAILEGNSDELAKIQSALEDPVWGVWLGRKSCIPALPLSPCPGDSAQGAFDALGSKLKLTPCPLAQFDCQVECSPAESGASDAFFQSDAPVDFERRRFNNRAVKYLRKSQPPSAPPEDLASKMFELS